MNVSATSCSGAGGSCSITSCNSPFVDVDKSYSTGCECTDVGFGASCGNATGLGTIAVGSSTSRGGNLPRSGEDNWFVVSFAYTSATSYHPHIKLTPASGTTMLFDVVNACGIGAPSCGLTGGGGLLEWQAFGGGAPTGNTYSPTPSVGTLYIHIYQTGGLRTCAQYLLQVWN
jgi:hypothetical protein